MSQTNSPESTATISIESSMLKIVTNTLLQTRLEDNVANDILEDSLFLIGKNLKAGEAIKAFEVLVALNMAIGSSYLDSEAKKMADLNNAESSSIEAATARQEAYAKLYTERLELYENYLTPLSQGISALAIEESNRSI